MGATHGSTHGVNDYVFKAQALKNTLVNGAVQLVGALQAGVVNVEGVGILHDELAPTDQACARTSLITVLGLDLVERNRQILVRGVHVLD